MRSLFVITLLLILSSCHDGSSTHHQTYVISKSHATAAESKVVNEQPSE